MCAGCNPRITLISLAVVPNHPSPSAGEPLPWVLPNGKEGSALAQPLPHAGALWEEGVQLLPTDVCAAD